MQQLVEEIDADYSSSVRKKAYNIKMAIANIKSAWDFVTEQGMKGVWRNVCPDMTGSTPLLNATDICYEISQLARQAGFEEVDDTDVTELLESHNQELTNDDLIAMERGEKADEETDDAQATQVEKGLSTGMISKIMDSYQAALDMTLQLDPNEERSRNIIRNVKNAILPYSELL